MTWQENIRRWQALPAELKLQIRWNAIPRDVAESMAFEGEPVSEESIRATLDRIEPPKSLKPHPSSSDSATEPHSSPMSAPSPTQASPTPISTQVRMHLELRAEQLPVRQLGLDFAIVDTATTHLPGAARLFVQVDDSVTVRAVYLPEGISPGTLRTRLLPA